MTDRNFTDDEIIKALRCCASYDCSACPLYSPTINCVIVLPQKALELVDRYRAEIDRLNAVHADMTESLRLAAEANKDMAVELDAMRGAANSYKMHYETARAEAIKEFAERAKEKMQNLARMEYGNDEIYFLIGKSFIDNLVKEMTEEIK